MLIIDGGDELGKTTACKKLTEMCEARGIKAFYRHMSRPHPSFDFGYDYYQDIGPHYIQDRFHLGSLVWHKNVMTECKLSVIEGWIKSVGGLVIVFGSTDATWYANQLAQTHKEQMFKNEQILRANEVFLELSDRHADSLWQVNSNRDFPSDNALSGWIDEWQRRVKFAARML